MLQLWYTFGVTKIMDFLYISIWELGVLACQATE